jgi:hypothetical protein
VFVVLDVMGAGRSHRANRVRAVRHHSSALACSHSKIVRRL